MLLSDIGWLLLSLVVISLAYFNVWKHGVPNVFRKQRRRRELERLVADLV